MELKSNKKIGDAEKSEELEQLLFHLGDLVSLKTHPLYNGKNIKLGENIQADPHAIPPAMVVIEVVKDTGKDKIKYDEETGEKVSGGIFKYRCQFYATQEGKFKDFWFYGDVLAPIFLSSLTPLRKIKLGQKINFKTLDFEIGKRKESVVYEKNNSELIFNEELNNKTREQYKRENSAITNADEINIQQNISNNQSPTPIITNKVRKSEKEVKDEKTVVPLLTHLPPSMIITGIEKNKIETPIFKTNSKGEREVIREVSLYKIKCMWYNPIDAKFSEDWFIPEALISINEPQKDAKSNEQKNQQS